MADNPYWDGKVHKAAKFGDRTTVTGTAKDPQIYRRGRTERARLDAIAAAEIQAAKYARLPWPVRAIGRVLEWPVRVIGRVIGLFYKVTGPMRAYGGTYAHAPRPKWKPYPRKSHPGVSGERFADDSGVADRIWSGSIRKSV